MTTVNQLTNLADIAVSSTKKRKVADNTPDDTNAPEITNAADANTNTDPPTIAQQFSNLSMLRNLLDVKSLYLVQTMQLFEQRRRQGVSSPSADELTKFKNVVSGNNNALKKYSGIYNPDFILQSQLLDCKEIYLNRLTDFIERKTAGTYEDDRILIAKAQINHLDAVIHTEMSMLALEVVQNNNE